MNRTTAVIAPALNRLILLLGRAGVRSAWRMLKKPSGLLVALFMVLMLSFGIVPSVVMAFTNQSNDANFFSGLLTGNLALMMFVITAMMIATQAGNALLELRPPELQFVLAGPFNDSQILSYRLTTMLIGWIPLSGFFAVMMFAHLGSFPGAWLGIFLGLSFVTLISLLSTLIRPRLPAYGQAAVRVLALASIACVTLEVAYNALTSAPEYSFDSFNRLIQAGWAARILSAPFQPFARLAMSEGLSDFATQGGVCLAITAVATLLCYRCNSGFAELAVEGVARRQQKIDQIRSGNVFGRAKPGGERRSFPMLPWMNGFGPVAWSQSVSAVRRTGRLCAALITLGLIGSAIAFFMLRTYPSLLTESQRAYAVQVGMAAAGYIGFLITLTAQTGFSGNPRLLLWYQVIPIRPSVLAAGMLAGTATLLICVLVAFFLPAMVISNQTMLQSLSLFLAAFSIAMTYGSMINLITASTSLRPMPQGTPDVFQGARAIVFMLALTVAMIPALMIGALAALAGGAIFGFSWTSCSLSVAASLTLLQPPLWSITGTRFELNETLAG